VAQPTRNNSELAIPSPTTQETAPRRSLSPKVTSNCEPGQPMMAPMDFSANSTFCLTFDIFGRIIRVTERNIHTD
jgi:hypothetical protein